jgi:hypothetical protein
VSVRYRTKAKNVTTTERHYAKWVKGGRTG